MYISQTSIRVRYGETDQMGFVYYGHYASYYEVARVEALRQLGLTYKWLEEKGTMMPVLENHSVFLAPGRYDELLKIVTTIREKPTARIQFEYDVYNEENKLINQGRTVLAFISKETGRPSRPPAEMERVLSPFFS
jgi:acyl-CoA thioester hydrolase